MKILTIGSALRDHEIHSKEVDEHFNIKAQSVASHDITTRNSLFTSFLHEDHSNFTRPLCRKRAKLTTGVRCWRKPMKKIIALIVVALTFSTLGVTQAEARNKSVHRSSTLNHRAHKALTAKQKTLLARRARKKKSRLSEAQKNKLRRVAKQTPHRAQKAQVAKVRRVKVVTSTNRDNSKELNDVIQELDQIDWNSAEVAGLDPNN
jgi:hypothetical protein